MTNSNNNSKQLRSPRVPRLVFLAALVLLALGLLVAIEVRRRRLAEERAANAQMLQALLSTNRAVPAEPDGSRWRLQLEDGCERLCCLALSPDRQNWNTLRLGAQAVSTYKVRNGLTKRWSVRNVQSALTDWDILGCGRSVDLYHAATGRIRFVAPRGWSLRALVPEVAAGGRPAHKLKELVAQRWSDDFMRPQVGQNDGWANPTGRFLTLVQGGGIGKAANPFVLSCRVRDDTPARLTTGYDIWADYRAEISLRSLDAASVCRVEIGQTDKARVSFGWNGAEARWEMALHRPGAKRRLLGSWVRWAPPDNWLRLGIELKNPFAAEALLDGQGLGCVELPAPVYGPLHVVVEHGSVLMDDARVLPAGQEQPEWTPLFLKSRAFESKPLTKKKDTDFVKWAHDEQSVRYFEENVSGEPWAGCTFMEPVYGDLRCKLNGGETGQLAVRLERESGAVVQWGFRRQAGRWVAGHGPAEGEGAAPLELTYRNGVVRQHCGEQEIEIGSPPPGKGSLRLSVLQPGRKPVDPSKHEVLASNLWNEFFESAPIAWYWTDGGFGMRTRWTCETHWNFMGGAVRDAAVLFGKSAYSGDQTIDYYVSFKDLLAGAGKRRYCRHDLNFAFCTDGRNLSSGYAVILDAFDGSGSRLLRNGKRVAKADEACVPPFRGSYDDIHWRWFHVRAEKSGHSIRVFVDSKKVLEWDDPEPLAGGHVAFWTVRNGFMLARVRIAAQERAWAPAPSVFMPSETSPVWAPLEESEVQLKVDARTATAINRLGGGSFAVVWRGKSPDLRKTPVMQLPFSADKSVRVCMHARVDGRPYVIPVTGPAGTMWEPLDPTLIKASDQELFSRPLCSKQKVEAVVRPLAQMEDGMLTVDFSSLLAAGRAESYVESLVIGNSSNEGYLLAGIGGNPAGAAYTLGSPRFLKSAPEPDARAPMTIADTGDRWQVLPTEDPAQTAFSGKTLRVACAGGEKGKVVVGLFSAMDFAHGVPLRFRISNATSGRLAAALAFQTGEAYTWFESPAVRIESGASGLLEVSASATDFKCADSKWEHTASLDDAAHVSGVCLVLYVRAKGEVRVSDP